MLDILFDNTLQSKLSTSYGEKWETEHFIIWETYLPNGEIEISVDNKKVFNKVSQNPITFTESEVFRKNKLTRRGKRLISLLEFLKTKEGAKASATFDPDNVFEEFSNRNPKIVK